MAGEHEQYANPLLLDWVKEWLDTARERGMKSVTTYRNAYESLKACPITFKHPRQLVQLKGFGDKLSSRLTDKLKEHCEANGLPMPKNPRLSKEDRASLGAAAEEDEPAPPPKKARKAKPYVPTYRSGPYALILALATLDEDASLGMTKTKLIELAQENCDSSFTAPSDPTKFYTAWNSMKTLIDKDLVCEKGRPQRRYSLTDDGWDVARRIKKTTEGEQADDIAAGPSTRTESVRPDPVFNQIGRQASASVEPIEQPKPSSQYEGVVSNGPGVADNASLPKFTPIRLLPGSFTVHLALDNREVRALKDRDYMQEELTKKGVKPLVRALEIGDAQWIAKCHDPAALSRHGAEGDEVVLDWIVERKRLDDLVGSVKDGRFHEQKFRLRKSGVKNVIYIIEEISMDSSYFQKVEEMIQSSIASTQVVNGYFLKKTQKMDDTIRYLTRMTFMLKKMYERKPLLVIPTTVLTAQNYLPLLQHLREKEPSTGYYITYPAFASLASKSDMMTLRDIYLKMLMTTRGITGEKALEIQKKWKTPHDLIKAFEECGSGEQGTKRKREMVISGLPNLVGRKKIPKAVSQRLAEVWGDA
ncbi:Crossover junction endonuclease MUS81 [Colletotrichum siamense]|uniref:Crossover junction endonuclease MUS81 n=1 Tax=Colletotrichum siamense TaxID=690259 RepID=A0A9P5EDX4_COLSI|nr:Crossover junction endonuclease MUS81 [Colletotrichum siamense]KAI8153032.1 Crossover junction endonuclease MUS81 [Colletotrichum sp. SAR 10_70]KAI8153784.1 Crossover junction endonuclease MUS81 [Colletotrichum sp. SAR 10_71]KAI8176827.1 Crossover junction endonuclease MUS81 [Colletotrichum sp. SAR 10_75]KAI8179207.1 Crossover junction endonuclease MUS81 [Colletotrichum sp. SAR 10_65]KAI8204112.1 Crossover junction endonuclease MUS81 [Colletotrichum sp. SAR 10_76]KAI8221229.1 Crossover jun